LPFETAATEGTVRILLNTAEKTTEKIKVNVYAAECEWWFTVDYHKQKPGVLCFCREPALNSPEAVENMLSACCGLSVMYTDEARDDALFTDSDAFTLLETEA
jgi:hypothetical protein